MTDLIKYLEAERSSLVKKFLDLNHFFPSISDIQAEFNNKTEVSFYWKFTKEKARKLNQTKTKFNTLLDMVEIHEKIEIEYRKLCESQQKEIAELNAKNTP